jgi:hypothetical protein
MHLPTVWGRAPTRSPRLADASMGTLRLAGAAAGGRPAGRLVSPRVQLPGGIGADLPIVPARPHVPTGWSTADRVKVRSVENEVVGGGLTSGVDNEAAWVTSQPACVSGVIVYEVSRRTCSEAPLCVTPSP